MIEQGPPHGNGKPKNPSPLGTADEIFFQMAAANIDPRNRLIFEEKKDNPTRRRIAKRKLGTILAKPIIAIGVEPILNRVEDKWMPLIAPEIPDGYREILLEKAKNPNAVFIITGNHYDHANGIEMMFMSKMALDIMNSERPPENQLKQTRLIIAKSLEDGMQDAFMQAIIEQAEKNHFPKYNLSTLACITKHDQERRHMNKNQNLAYIRELIKIAKAKNVVLGLFGEGSVDGGRFTNGKRNGMRTIEPSVDIIFEVLRRAGAEIVFLPYGSWGPNRIHTDIKWPTLKALKSLYFDPNPTSMVSIKVGLPITETEMKNKILKEKGQSAAPDDIRDFLGRNCIAKLLPPEFQGVFREK